MSDDALFWNAKPPSPRKPRPAEPLWTLQKGARRTQFELRYHGEYGVEAQLLRDGELLMARRFETRALAVQWAEQERALLETEGWSLSF